MQLRITTLLAMIAGIYFAYYYFIYLSQKRTQTHTTAQLLAQPDVTILETAGYENFNVTPISDSDADSEITVDIEPETVYVNNNYYDPNTVNSLSGNIRPDNVKYHNLPEVTELF